MQTNTHIAKSGRSPRRVYSRPARDHASSVGIRMRRVSTRHASEFGLAGPVPLVDMATNGALSRRVLRVYQYQSYARTLRLVGHQQSQLRKRPAMQNRTLLAPNRYPFADALQLFQRNPTPGAFGGSNDPLGALWFTHLAKRLSLPASFFRRRLAARVCFF